MIDRNFDDIADYFEKRIYEGKKGQLRQAVITRDLNQHLPPDFDHQPKRILDLAGGLGYFAINSASKGHRVFYNDLSKNMLEKAVVKASSQNVDQLINWNHGPYQEFLTKGTEPFDLIFCHALVEWLAEPHKLIPYIKTLLKPTGYLSLCFYNPAGMTFRNLIKGNFNYLNDPASLPDQGSLTPHNPQDINTVRHWLQESEFGQVSFSGVRVFSDYIVEKRGGLADPDAVFNMELAYSNQSPFNLLGRYIHTIQKR